VTEKPFKVLLAGLGRGPFAALAPVLDRQNLDVVRVATPEAAIEYASVQRVDLVVFASVQRVDLVVFDAEPSEMRLDEIVPVFRAKASASPRSFVLVMAKRGSELDARVVPRAAVRFAIRLSTSLDDGVEVFFGLTENVSLSGMLVKTPAIIAPGQQVAYELLYDAREEAISGDADIVRHTVSEGFDGVGLRFRSFKNEGRERLDAILADIFGELFER